MVTKIDFFDKQWVTKTDFSDKQWVTKTDFFDKHWVTRIDFFNKQVANLLMVAEKMDKRAPEPTSKCL